MEVYFLVALSCHLLASIMLRGEHEETRAFGFIMSYLWPATIVLICCGLVIACFEWMGKVNIERNCYRITTKSSITKQTVCTKIK